MSVDIPRSLIAVLPGSSAGRLPIHVALVRP